MQPGGLKCFEKRESRGKRKGKGSYKNPDCENRLTSRSEEKKTFERASGTIFTKEYMQNYNFVSLQRFIKK